MVWNGAYDDNGSLTTKQSSLNPEVASDQTYLYDSDSRMTAALASGIRISDSFYHLQGGRLFEGQLANHFVQGSLFINPYYELKVSSGQVYMVKHILAGGRRVASVYEKVTSYNRPGLGCSTWGDNVAYASPKEIMIGMFVIFGLPLFIVVLVGTRGFRTSGIRKHPIKSFALLGICIICLIEFSPYPILLLDGTNPVDDRLIAKNLERILTNIYAGAKIPISEIDKRFFDNQKEQKEKGKEKAKLRLSFGPTQAKADVLVKDTLYFHTDQLGSTRVITREDGSLYQYLNYMPFGKILEGEIIGPPLPSWAAFKNSYTGQEYDKSTGLYFYQARFYDADIGRFISADTLISSPINGQTYNRYTYVNNNPFKYNDPTGHDFAGSFVKELIEAIIIGVLIATGHPYIALLFIAFFAAAEAASTGATGWQLVGAIAQSVIMSSVAKMYPPVGLILFAYGVVQAATQNNPDAWGELLGSLVGGLFAENISHKAGAGGGTTTGSGTPPPKATVDDKTDILSSVEKRWKLKNIDVLVNRDPKDPHVGIVVKTPENYKLGPANSWWVLENIGGGPVFRPFELSLFAQKGVTDVWRSGTTITWEDFSKAVLSPQVQAITKWDRGPRATFHWIRKEGVTDCSGFVGRVLQSAGATLPPHGIVHSIFAGSVLWQYPPPDAYYKDTARLVEPLPPE